MHRTASPQHTDHELPRLVGAARAGDDAAWTRLVERYDPMTPEEDDGGRAGGHRRREC